jgi:hypothetical protein
VPHGVNIGYVRCRFPACGYFACSVVTWYLVLISSFSCGSTVGHIDVRNWSVTFDSEASFFEEEGQV